MAGRELAPPRIGAATALILCRVRGGGGGGVRSRQVKGAEGNKRGGGQRLKRRRSDSAHLDERPVGSEDLDDDHHGDADHGGQRQSPTDSDGPVRILVDLVVRQRLVFDQREDEAALGRKTGGPRFVCVRLLNVPMKASSLGVSYHAQ